MDARTIRSSYIQPLSYPKEKTMVDYILARLDHFCHLGHGSISWITNTVTEAACSLDQVEPLSRRIGSALFKMGLQKNDIVLYSTNEPYLLHVFFIGIWRANAILRTIYPGEDAQTILHWLKETQSKFFLCDSSTIGTIQEAIKNVAWDVQLICMDPVGTSFDGVKPKVLLLDDLLNDDGVSCPQLDLCGDDTAVILATSGTTGLSKGCVHTHSSMLATITCYKDWLYNREDQGQGQGQFQVGYERGLVLGRPTHISGFGFGFSALGAGKEILMMRDVTKENIFEAVHKYKPQWAFSFPTFVLNLANDPEASKYDLTSLKMIVTGGVLVHRSFIDVMNSKLNVKVSIGYGMTEGAIMCATRNFDPVTQGQHYDLPNAPDRSVGKLIPGTLLQIRDLDTDEPLPAYQRGEICYKSPLMCGGYWNRPEETAKSFPDGWIRSGDIGYYDDKEFIFVVNRLKECFKYFNNHISPSELEMVILRHPAVDKVNVVGVTDPNGGDTIPRAFVTLEKMMRSQHQTY